MLAIIAFRFGEVAEWSNVPDSKSGVLSKVPRVRIPPSPPSHNVSIFALLDFGAIYIKESF